MRDFEFIQHADALGPLSERLARAEHVAVDTEFMREKTYYPRWCLTQIALPDGIVLIDVMEPGVGEGLVALLSRAPATKVLHSARQDLEVFALADAERPLVPLFDTQIAAALVGFPDQVGYANLVKKRLDVELPKDSTRTDWSIRPLTERQLAYAADDVRYLYELFPLMLAELESRNRRAWAEEDCARVSANFDIASVYAVNDAPARVKGRNRLNGRALLAADRLAVWREQAAQRSDRPRRWIMDDRDLTEAAVDMAEGRMRQNRRINALREDFRAEVERVAEAVRAVPADQVPRVEDERVPTAEERRKVKQLAELVASRASELGLDSAILARRRDLEAAVRGDFSGLCFSGWREEAVGGRLRAVL